MPYVQLAETILQECETIETHRAMVGPDSEIGVFLAAAIDILRGEYEALVDEAISHHRPVPPRFPDTAFFATRIGGSVWPTPRTDGAASVDPVPIRPVAT